MLKLLPGRAPATDPALPARRRFLRRRRARRWLVWRRLLLALAPVAALGGVVWLLLFSSLLAVHDVEVHGTAVLSAADVRRAAQPPLGVPLATADLEAVRARVEDLAPVESVAVSRGWPDRLRIEVTERSAVAVVQRAGEWHGLDDSGVIFRRYDERPPALPEVTVRAGTTVEALAEAGAVLTSLPSELLDRVQTLDVTSVDAIRLRLRGEATVSWGSAEQSVDKARVLAALMAEHPRAEVYDVTAPGRPTVRL